MLTAAWWAAISIPRRNWAYFQSKIEAQKSYLNQEQFCQNKYQTESFNLRQLTQCVLGPSFSSIHEKCWFQQALLKRVVSTTTSEIEYIQNIIVELRHSKLDGEAWKITFKHISLATVEPHVNRMISTTQLLILVAFGSVTPQSSDFCQ